MEDNSNFFINESKTNELVQKVQALDDAQLSLNVKDKTMETDGIIDKAFSHAVMSSITTNEDIKNDIKDTAEKVIKNKTEAISSDAEKVSKKAYFNNKRGACECFGFNEETTEKWAVNIMSIWHNVMTAVWLFIGFFTFAPVTFIAKKISVIFKKAWLAILLALVIYFLVVAVPIVIALVQV